MSSTDRSTPGVAFGPGDPHLIALDRLLARLEVVERRIRQAEAERVALLAEALDLAALESERRISSVPEGRAAELAYRAVRAEIAVTLRQSEQTAERRMTHAFTLTRHYPRVFEAYREGLVSERHTSVIVDAGSLIGTGDSLEAVTRRSAYERAVLASALEETPNRLQPIARRLAEQFAAQDLDERHAEARRRRHVRVADAGDGMAELVAHLPAVEAHGIYDRLTRMSRALEREQDDSDLRRTRDEIRADLLADLLLEGAPAHSDAGGDRGAGLSSGLDSGLGAGLDAGLDAGLGLGAIRASVQIIVHEEHLSEAHPGDADPTGEHPSAADPTGEHPTGDHGARRAAALPSPFLVGYGPIDTATARLIAGRASHWDRTHQDPVTGAILAVDRYRPSEQMRRLLGARDQHCRFPGCRVPLARCDLDHTVDAARGGATSTDNLAHLCRGHHTLKHHTGWRVEQRIGGVLDWTSPTGRRYRERPPGGVRFAPIRSPDETPF